MQSCGTFHLKKETKSEWQSDSTITGEADCLIQSILKFRSSLFKGLRSVRQSLTKKGLAGVRGGSHGEKKEKVQKVY